MKKHRSATEGKANEAYPIQTSYIGLLARWSIAPSRYEGDRQ